MQTLTDILINPLYFWWMRIIIVFLAGGLYNLCNELEDECVRSTWKKGFKLLWKQYKIEWLNAKTSSDNKWMLDEDGFKMPYIKKWYHFGVYPKWEEAFAYSSTILVFLSDGEHTFQFYKNIFILIGITAINLPAMVAWLIGKSLFQFIKEKWLKNIN